MPDSPTAAALHAVLRSSSSPNSPPFTSASLPGRATQTVKASARSKQPSWGETLSAAWYGKGTTAGGASGVGSSKGKGRAAMPLWEPVEGHEHDECTADGVRRSRNARATGSSGLQGEEDNAPVDPQGPTDELDELAGTILWQAGNDHAASAGPLLVITCSRIPAPTAVSHADLLAKLRFRLEAFASSGSYSIVLLVNPTPHAPATANLVSNYLSLSRMARKNLRRVWVVGGGWWTRVILSIFSSTLLSSKSVQKQKIVQCPSLTSLAEEMGAEAFVQVEFPLEVYSANTLSDPEIKLPASSPPLQRTFGVPIEQLIGEDASRLPSIVRDCVEVLLSQGPESIGIFRRSPSASTVKILEGAYDRGHPVSLSSYPDAPYLAASLLKLFLRSLPTPIFPLSIYPITRACPLMDDQAIPFIRSRILHTLEPPALLLLQHLLCVLYAIASNSTKNLMTSENLVICLCPALIGGLVASREDIEMCRVPGMEVGTMRGLKSVKETGSNTLGGVLRVMIDHYADLFDETSLSALSATHRSPHTVDLSPSPSASNSVPLSPSQALQSPSSPSQSGSFVSAPHAPIAQIPEDDESEAGPPSSPRLASPTAHSTAQGMLRSTSHSSLNSSSSRASPTSAVAGSVSSLPSSPGRVGTLKLSKGGTVRFGKSNYGGGGQGVVTVQEVKGMFAGPGDEGGREGEVAGGEEGDRELKGKAE
ncbi:hypothetical protein JCM11251_005944 [Rhodosporidiobolus azoricus]